MLTPDVELEFVFDVVFAILVLFTVRVGVYSDVRATGAVYALVEAVLEADEGVYVDDEGIYGELLVVAVVLVL